MVPRALEPLGPLVKGPWGHWEPWAKAPGAPGPKLPTVRQSYLLSAQATYCQAKLPTVRQAPNRSIDLHPTSAYMHPRVSAYMHPTSAYFAPNNRILRTQQLHTCTQPLHIHAPNIRIHAPKSLQIHAPNIRILCTQPYIPFYSYIIINIALKHFYMRLGIFLFIYTCSRLRRSQ